MNKVYSRISWKNYPNTSTALNETNLNRMDKAIDDLDNRVIEQDSTKANQTTVNNMVKNWTMDETTGVITVEKQDGSKIMFDLNIEKIPVTFELSPSGILTMTTSDGTQFTANIGSMIPVLTFNESDQIAVSVSGSGVNKTYSFSIKDNSITENKLQPNFLADIKVQSANASLSANNAETSATQAQSYAIGGTGTRENEDTDNAMYYYEQAKQTDIGQISSKVDEINSKLSKQLGNHTVKADVPENAVFTDTVYDDTEVKESISAQSTEMMDIKMLGWSVPKDCPIQNEVNGNQFVQKVGRVDLGSLEWEDNAPVRFISSAISDIKPPSNNNSLTKIFLKDYTTTSVNSLMTNEGKFVGASTQLLVSIRDSSYTDATTFKQAMQGQYLYYELATYNTITIDGNELGETVNDVRKETTVNLLNPTLQTTTQNGITCTNNGDGTYTLNGTASADTTFVLKNMADIIKENANKTLRFVSKGDTLETYFTQVYFNNATPAKDLGSGITFKVPINVSETNVAVLIKSSAVLSNILIKPMITTNLDATYDDFVPYTGDTGKLNSDVADIKKDTVILKKRINYINDPGNRYMVLSAKSTDNFSDLIIEFEDGLLHFKTSLKPGFSQYCSYEVSAGNLSALRQYSIPTFLYWEDMECVVFLSINKLKFATYLDITFILTHAMTKEPMSYFTYTSDASKNIDIDIIWIEKLGTLETGE